MSLLQKKDTLAAKAERFLTGVDGWKKAQPAWVEGAVMGLQGSCLGSILGLGSGLIVKTMKRKIMAAQYGGSPMAPEKYATYPLRHAREFAVILGVGMGTEAFLKRWRGKDDITTQLVAGLCSGVSYTLVSDGVPVFNGAPIGYFLVSALPSCFIYSLLRGVIYTDKRRGGRKGETVDVEYVRVKAMLKRLGMEQYERNVRKGLLTDATIGLWDTQSLQEVRIPPGPRLQILAHIDQYRHILRPAMPIPKQLPSDY